jgi:metal transporter CNNM
LVIGSCAAPFVRILVYIFFPISYPLAWILDKLLGHELGTIYTKEDFHQLLEIHAERGEGYNREMTMVMTGALKYQDLKVIDIMTTVEEVYMLSGDVKLSYENILAIFKAGYSRIPVYEGKNKNDIIGLLLTKDLIFIDPADNISVIVFVRIFGRGKSIIRLPF